HATHRDVCGRAKPVPVTTRNAAREPFDRETTANQWSWRESNPRPSTLTQGYSGRRLLGVFSAPVLEQTRHRQAQPRWEVLLRSRGRTRTASLRNEAAPWDGGVPRPTLHLVASGGEGEVSALSVGTYWFSGIVNEMTLDPRPASPES